MRIFYNSYSIADCQAAKTIIDIKNNIFFAAFLDFLNMTDFILKWNIQFKAFPSNEVLFYC